MLFSATVNFYCLFFIFNVTDIHTANFLAKCLASDNTYATL